MRPVPDEFPVSQEFGSDATQGVAANSNPNSGTGYLVYLYGNYQPYGHAGQDIACPVGTPVRAIADGTVIWADWGTNLPGDDSDAGYRQRWYMYKNFPGIVTLIQHDGWISMYGHLSSNDAAPVGTRVREGQVIGLSGNTKAPGVTLGAHLHVGALVDLSYSCRGGLIYGCTDPTPFYGSGTITVQSATITPTQEERMADQPIPAQQAEDIVQSTTDRVVAALTAALLTKADGAYMNNARDAQHTETLAAMFSKADGAWQNGQIANLPALVLNQSFKLPDGTPTNVAGILSAIHSQPATITGGVLDVDGLVARLKAELPPTVLAEITSKLSQ